MKKYNPSEIEPKWQAIWEQTGIYQPDLENAKKPFYNLMMFPYPSAEGLHVGSMYAFSGADVYGRFKRMQGNAVFEPIGLDGFGIHAENHAIKTNSHPMEHAKRTQANFYRQLKSIGNSYAWRNKLETYDPEYYKWTQWLFTQLFKAGLAYRKKASVNFCPQCKTVLADEQVVTKSRIQHSAVSSTQGEIRESEVKVCERCETPVAKREVAQWFFRITEYADRLLNNSTRLEWSEKVKIAQQNWIGKKTGARIEFRVENSAVSIPVFTTRPDTLYGVTFLVIAPEHEFVDLLLQSKVKGQKSKAQKITEYIESIRNKSETDRIAQGKEKTGVFSGLYATHPLTGDKLPIWIADYVLGNYGTGAIMGVPAHDQRDMEFARAHDLPIVYVIDPVTGIEQKLPKKKRKIVALLQDKSGKILTINWGEKLGKRLFIGGTGEFREDPARTARREIIEETGYTDFILIASGSETVHHRYFSYSKHTPTNAETKIFYFQLQSNKRRAQRLEQDEQDKFILEWVSPDQARQDITDPLHRYVFDRFIDHKAYDGVGVLRNSGEWTGWQVPDAIDKIILWLADKQIGTQESTYHLRDWLISRQRYWGAPIPMIFCRFCAQTGKSWFTSDQAWNASGWYPVADEDLPVKLPFIKDYKPLGTGKSPLATDPDFYKVTCPGCGRDAVRETDISDNFLDSSWYFLRYLATDWPQEPFPSVKFARRKKQDARAKEEIATWKQYLENSAQRVRFLPVTMYIGGAEHAVLHLLYARFLTMALCDLGYLDFEEPFSRFFAHGLIIKDGAKMSKSRGNVINPDAYIEKFGADTLRCYLLFLGPFDQGGDFRDSGIEGMHRFLKRIWRLFVVNQTVSNVRDVPANRLSLLHRTIKGVTDDIANFHYNTAIAKLMIWYNALAKQELVSQQEQEVFLKLFAPFAPHMTDELWHQLRSRRKRAGKSDGSIHTSLWPAYDPNFLEQDQVTIAVQVNGKLRSTVVIDQEQSQNQAAIERIARADTKVSKFLSSQIRKIIFIPGRVINFVMSQR